MAKKKKKSTQSHLWTAAKWVLAIGGGAVVGAYTVRAVDRHLKLKPGSGLPGDAPRRENPSLPEAHHHESPVHESPMANPLAMQVMSPVMPVPVPVPAYGGAMFGVPPMQMPSMPPPGHLFESTAREAEPVDEAPAPLTAREIREQRRAEKQREFEELVRQFEEG